MNIDPQSNATQVLPQRREENISNFPSQFVDYQGLVK